MAIRNPRPEPGGIVHADHRTQFTSWIFGEKIRSAGLLPSFGSVGDGLDNAMMESFWSSMLGRTPEPEEVEHQGRTRQRDLRVHRKLPQPAAKALRPRLSHTHQIRDTQPQRHPRRELATTTGTKNAGQVRSGCHPSLHQSPRSRPDTVVRGIAVSQENDFAYRPRVAKIQNLRSSYFFIVMNMVPNRYRWAILRRILGDSRAARRLGVRVGSDCRILSCNIASEPWLVEIEDRVTISTEVLFVTHDGTGWLVSDVQGRRYMYAPIHIGTRSFIGARSVLLPGVSIGADCIVGAGSVVTKSVPSGLVVAGNPARVVSTTAQFRERALRWPSESIRRGSSYREKVESVKYPHFRPDIIARG